MTCLKCTTPTQCMDIDHCSHLMVPFSKVAHTDKEPTTDDFIDLLVHTMGGPLTAEEIRLCEGMTSTEFDEYLRKRMLP